MLIRKFLFRFALFNCLIVSILMLSPSSSLASKNEPFERSIERSIKNNENSQQDIEMKEKKNIFEDLPHLIKFKIVNYLECGDIINLLSTSKTMKEKLTSYKPKGIFNCYIDEILYQKQFPKKSIIFEEIKCFNGDTIKIRIKNLKTSDFYKNILEEKNIYSEIFCSFIKEDYKFCDSSVIFNKWKNSPKNDFYYPYRDVILLDLGNLFFENVRKASSINDSSKEYFTEQSFNLFAYVVNNIWAHPTLRKDAIQKLKRFKLSEDILNNLLSKEKTMNSFFSRYLPIFEIEYMDPSMD